MIIQGTGIGLDNYVQAEREEVMIEFVHNHRLYNPLKDTHTSSQVSRGISYGCVKLHLTNGSVFASAPDQLIKTPESFSKVIDIHSGDTLMTLQGLQTVILKQIKPIVLTVCSTRQKGQVFAANSVICTS